MIEILDQLDMLARPDLQLSWLCCAGVPYGAIAAEVIQPDRITELSYPLMYRTVDSPTGCYDSDGRWVSRDELISNALGERAMVHFAGGTSYLVKSGRVAGFALYGRNSHLEHFNFLRNYREFLDYFGPPDLAQEQVAYGDLMGYDNYYRTCLKHVAWDSWSERVSLINLGEYEGNDAPR